MSDALAKSHCERIIALTGIPSWIGKDTAGPLQRMSYHNIWSVMKVVVSALLFFKGHQACILADVSSEADGVIMLRRRFDLFLVNLRFDGAEQSTFLVLLKLRL